MNKNVIWACAISNMIAVSCCTLLAVAFDRWWIVLFSLLFFTLPKSIKQYYRICDSCGKTSPWADSHEAAILKAKANGWVHYEDGNRDYCPECKMDF
jgi:hypothetical protein